MKKTAEARRLYFRILGIYHKTETKSFSSAIEKGSISDPFCLDSGVGKGLKHYILWFFARTPAAGRFS